MECSNCGTLNGSYSADLDVGDPADKIEIPTASVPDGSAVGFKNGFEVIFSPKTRWVHVLNSGGVELFIWNISKTRRPYRVGVSDLVPIPYGKCFISYADSGSAPTTEIILEGLDHQDAIVRSANRSNIKATVVGGSGSSTGLNGHTTPAILTGTGAGVLYTDTNANVIMIIAKALDTNANPFFISDSAANADVAATRHSLYQGTAYNIWRRNAGPITFGWRGTLNEVLELWRYLA